MPFDGPEFIVTRFAAPQDCMLKQPPGRLSALLDQVGIEPVPDAILDAHKAAEVRRHPANFFWRHPRLYGVLTLLCSQLLVLTIAGALAEGPGTGHYPSLPWVILVGAVLLAFLKLILFTRALGPAKWLEKPVYHFAGIPPAVRTLAQQLRQHGDNSVTFAVGTLVQDEKILDPYLLVIKHDRRTGQFERACLGVWDGKTVLYCAGRKVITEQMPRFRQAG